MIGLDGEKMSKSGATWCSSPSCAAPASTRWRSGWRLLDGHYRTDREWTGGRLPAPRSGWRPGGARSLVAPGRRPHRLLRGCATGWPTTSTPRRALALVDAWAAATLAGDDADQEDQAPGWSATPSTRCWASPWRSRGEWHGRTVPVHRPDRPRAGGGAAAPAAVRSVASRGRVTPEPDDALRTAFERDRDRILHAKAFRRLKHKTQVFLNPEGDHFVTRLTHTLQVTQVARSLARALGLNETLAEAIALAHDVGHSPFGHLGEDALEPYVAGGLAPRGPGGADRGGPRAPQPDLGGTRRGAGAQLEDRSAAVHPRRRVRALRRPDRLPLPRRPRRHPRRGARVEDLPAGARASSATPAARWWAR